MCQCHHGDAFSCALRIVCGHGKAAGVPAVLQFVAGRHRALVTVVNTPHASGGRCLPPGLGTGGKKNCLQSSSRRAGSMDAMRQASSVSLARVCAWTPSVSCRSVRFRQWCFRSLFSLAIGSGADLVTKAVGLCSACGLHPAGRWTAHYYDLVVSLFQSDELRLPPERDAGALYKPLFVLLAPSVQLGLQLARHPKGPLPAAASSPGR